MLQRARLLPTHNSFDPLDNARLWRTPIWSVEKILKWLDKVSASIVLPKEELCWTNGKSCIKAPVKQTELKPPFIKFEPFNRNARPVYQQLSVWPTINLDIAPGESPFRAAPERFIENLTARSTMRRKTRSRVREQRGAPQPGYCEICHVEYADLAKHARSEEHVTFVRNDDNYLSLDSLIAAGASVEAFLRLNGTSSTDDTPSTGTICRRSARNSTVSLEIRCNGDYGSPKADKRISNIDGGGTPRATRSSSACEKTPKETPAPMSPASSDPGHRLRSRGQLWLPSNLLGTTAEDDGNPAKPGPKESAKHENEQEPEENGIGERGNNEREDDKDRPSRRVPLTTDVDEQIVNKNSRHPKDKRKCSSRPNAEKTRSSSLRASRVSEDRERGSGNKTYYKVEVLGSKTHPGVSDLRDTDEPKTGALTRSATANNGACENGSCATDRLVVKFKRVRRSELSVLSDEAENFMFPRRDESSSENDDVDTDDERINLLSASSDLKCNEQNETRTLKSIEEADDASSSATDAGSHCSAGLGQGSKKRRRTHAELFISDNQKYYKFETPGSRLRFQGSFLPLITGHDVLGDSTATCVKIKDEEILIEPKDESAGEEERDIVLPPIERLTYSFERLTKSEPLLRDEIIVDYSRFSDTNRPVSFVMPYEMKPLPPLDPRICKEEFEKRLERSNSRLILEEAECEKLDSSKPSESSTRVDSVTGVTRRKYRKRRNLLHGSGRNPRKSPRQHASTLAILSLLQQRKRRSDKNKSVTSESNDTLSSIPEEVSSLSSPVKLEPVELSEELGCTDVEKMAREIDEMLTQDPVPGDDIPIVLDNVCFNKEVDIVHLFGTYSECTAMEDSISDILPRRKRSFLPGSPLFAPKGVRRKMKRKKNRTGWPKKKRIFNKKGSDKSEQCDGNESDIAPGEKSVNSVNSDICDSVIRDCGETLEAEETKVQPRDICSRTRNRERCKSSELNSIIDSQQDTTKLESLIIHEKQERTYSRIDKKSTDHEVNQDITHINEKELKNSSSDHTSMLLVSSKERAGNSVNVDLDKWENAEKLLSIKYIESSGTETSGFEGRRASSDLQPIVRVQKLNVIEMSHKRRLRNSSSPIRCTPAKRSRRESPIYKNHSRSWRDR